MSTLPATRLIRRKGRRGRWSLAIALALALNALLIGALARSAPAIGADVLPPLRPLAAVPPPVEPARATAPAAAASHAPVLATPALPALPAPALPLAALGPPAADGWLAGLGTGLATGATVPAAPAPAPAWDTPPRPRDTFDLQRFYPERQHRRNEGASVAAEVEIAVDGAVGAVRVLGNDGHPAFAEATVRAIRAMRWSPAEAGGHPVAATTRLTLRWEVR